MSFLSNLKKNIGVANQSEEEIKTTPSRKPVERKIQKKNEKILISAPEETKEKKQQLNEQKWPATEGQLAVDVFETDTTFVIQSTIAGVKASDLDIFIEKDLVIIKGKREKPNKEGETNYLYQECYWGPFSREIILPEEIDESQTKAVLKDGVLTLEISKASRHKGKKIEIKEG